MVRLANNLTERGHKIDFLVLEDGPYRQQLLPTVRVIDLNGDSRTPLRSVLKVREYLNTERPEAMVTALKQSSMVALWAKRISSTATRVIPTIHGNMNPRDKRLHLQMGRRLIYRWADQIVAVSDGVREDFSRYSGVDPDRIRVIYNGVVSDEFLAGITAPIDHPWLLDKPVPVVLSAGRMVPAKDFSTLIRAFARVRAKRRLRLIILGDGPERVPLINLARDLNVHEDVDMPGFRQCPQAYMSRSDLFVLSSTVEGLSNVLIEAMATGTPVVSTDCKSGPREVLADGEYGSLVPVGDDEALAKAMCRQLDEPTSASKLMEWASTFSVEACATEYLETAVPSGVNANDAKIGATGGRAIVAT